MTIKKYLQVNPFRVMGVSTSDAAAVLSSNISRMRVYAAIGKNVVFPLDLVPVFGESPDRGSDNRSACMAALSSPKERLLNGLFWFMNVTETDAKILATLASDGNLLSARKKWEQGEQDMSSLQNQLVCCLLMDARSYAKALQLATVLYNKFGAKFIFTVGNGFGTIAPEQLLPTFMAEVAKATEGDWNKWDKAVGRLDDASVGQLWAEAQANLHLEKLRHALNVARTTEYSQPIDNYNIAVSLMRQAEKPLRLLKGLAARHVFLLSHYVTIADTVCEEILNHEIRYYNRSGWTLDRKRKILILERFCYRNAATIRFKNRCRQNINITLGRDEYAPLFPNGTPDNLRSESDRKKRNVALGAIIYALQNRNPENERNIRNAKLAALVSGLQANANGTIGGIVSGLQTNFNGTLDGIVSGLQTNSNGTLGGIVSGLQANVNDTLCGIFSALKKDESGREPSSSGYATLLASVLEKIGAKNLRQTIEEALHLIEQKDNLKEFDFFVCDALLHSLESEFRKMLLDKKRVCRASSKNHEASINPQNRNVRLNNTMSNHQTRISTKHRHRKGGRRPQK